MYLRPRVAATAHSPKHVGFSMDSKVFWFHHFWQEDWRSRIIACSIFPVTTVVPYFPSYPCPFLASNTQPILDGTRTTCGSLCRENRKRTHFCPQIVAARVNRTFPRPTPQPQPSAPTTLWHCPIQQKHTPWGPLGDCSLITTHHRIPLDPNERTSTRSRINESSTPHFT